MKIDRAIEILEEIRRERGNVEVVWQKLVRADDGEWVVHQPCVIELALRKFPLPSDHLRGSGISCAAVIPE